MHPTILTLAIVFASGALSAPAAPKSAAVQDPAPKPKPAPAVPAVGKPAPVVRLNDHTGAAVTIGGKAETWTVLAFYPKAATPG